MSLLTDIQTSQTLSSAYILPYLRLPVHISGVKTAVHIDGVKSAVVKAKIGNRKYECSSLLFLMVQLHCSAWCGCGVDGAEFLLLLPGLVNTAAARSIHIHYVLHFCCHDCCYCNANMEYNNDNNNDNNNNNIHS